MGALNEATTFVAIMVKLQKEREKLSKDHGLKNVV